MRFRVGIRAGAATREQIEAAGLGEVPAFGPSTYGGRGETQEELRHYVLVTADDAEAAVAHVAQALGWSDPHPGDIIAEEVS